MSSGPFPQPKRRRRARPHISYENFWRVVTRDGRGPCALRHLGGCRGRMDAHHYFPKRRIDNQLGGKHKPEAIAAKQDVRNGVCLCRGHHDLVESPMSGVEAPEPREYHFFLIEHHLYEPVRDARASMCAGRNKFSRGP